MKNWSLSGRDTADSKRMMIINEDYRTTIRVSESKRSDTGTYKNGTETCACNVIDVPGPPEGPVDPKEFRKDYMVIHQKVPKDDGGREIKHYIVEKQDQEDVRWVPREKPDCLA